MSTAEKFDPPPSTAEATLATLRRFYARAVTATAGVADARIVEAFATVRREEFLGPGPWHFKLAADGYLDSETNDPAVLYQVPSGFFFAFAGPRIVGRVSIRHRLNEALARRSGHIGYVVVPEFRRRGYATAILRQSLRIARERYSIGRVLVTCDADNVASIKTIERNGGILEGVGDANPGEKPFLRYWIDTSG